MRKPFTGEADERRRWWVGGGASSAEEVRAEEREVATVSEVGVFGSKFWEGAELGLSSGSLWRICVVW